MAFKVAWKGVSVQQGKPVNLIGEEFVDGQTAMEAMQNACNAIVAKLQIGEGYALTNVSIEDQDGSTTVNLQEVYAFLSSFNAAGNLVEGAMNVPTSFELTKSSNSDSQWQVRAVSPDSTEKGKK